MSGFTAQRIGQPGTETSATIYERLARARAEAEDAKQDAAGGSEESDDDADDEDEGEGEGPDDAATRLAEQLQQQRREQQREYERKDAQRQAEMQAKADEMMADAARRRAPKRQMVKIPLPPNPKTDAQNELVAAVQNAMLSAMEVTVETNSRRKTYGKLRTNKAAASQVPAKLPSPLVLALRGSDPLSCAWNKACARHFAVHFMEQSTTYNIDDHGPKVKAIFMTYLRTLRKQFKKQVNPPTFSETFATDAANARNVRCSTLSDTRFDTVERYNAILDLLPQDSRTLSICLSYDNTSDDELLPASDGEGDHSYKIVGFLWRHPEVNHFFTALDDRHRRWAIGRKDQPMRERRVSKAFKYISCRAAPPGLPEDWYEPSWLKNLKMSDPLAYAELSPAPPAMTRWGLLKTLKTTTSEDLVNGTEICGLAQLQLGAITRSTKVSQTLRLRQVTGHAPIACGVPANMLRHSCDAPYNPSTTLVGAANQSWALGMSEVLTSLVVIDKPFSSRWLVTTPQSGFEGPLVPEPKAIACPDRSSVSLMTDLGSRSS
ncbi:hypothetical protein BKA62DRAFT_676860 [Auriculariales sp. MPI-PUGE-AT-0066]|nr:hypothetical protein BKA62DRAFT_676860 [Auriculariales sp. MPI-PUGE-AT-0066]